MSELRKVAEVWEINGEVSVPRHTRGNTPLGGAKKTVLVRAEFESMPTEQQCADALLLAAPEHFTVFEKIYSVVRYEPSPTLLVLNMLVTSKGSFT